MAKRVSVKGKGADLFFGDYPTAPVMATDPPAVALPDPDTPDSDAHVIPAAPPTVAEPAAPQVSSRPPSRPVRTQAPQPASTLASIPASEPARLDAATIEAIRKTVKVPGKEVSFIRLTPDEKGRLADIVYTYKRQGVKTSENEINRIAVNSMLIDYRENGEESVLAKVLAALRA